MRPVNSAGANKNGLQIRPDLPRHDHTAANYWLVDVIRYQNAAGHLRLGSGLSGEHLAALEEGRQRAADHLLQAASLKLEGNTLKVVNLTGHKLITGYPEGRRMWLNIKWYDAQGALLREDGAYGPLADEHGQPVLVEDPATDLPVQVESILDVDDPNLRLYEAHFAITQEWAGVLIDTGVSPDLVLSYDRTSGEGQLTLGGLAAQAPGSYHETFHFVLNNFLASDNRIPPYGMRYDEALRRNALPVPASQYGNPGPGETYRFWDEIDLDAVRPPAAVSAGIDLLYQGTSWEYIQFLEEASEGTNPAEGGNAFLGEEGEHMLEAWINAEIPVALEVAGDRRMVPPFTMATVVWNASFLSVGGTVSGLEGSGLVLQNNGGDDLAISGNGGFTFATALADGSDYAVTVKNQPSAPAQQCTVSNGTGTISSAAVSNVGVNCENRPDVIFADGFE